MVGQLLAFGVDTLRLPSAPRTAKLLRHGMHVQSLLIELDSQRKSVAAHDPAALAFDYHLRSMASIIPNRIESLVVGHRRNGTDAERVGKASARLRDEIPPRRMRNVRHLWANMWAN